MITMHRSNATNLAQLSIALPLVAGLLGYEQKQKVENHKKSEFAFHSTSEARQLPQDMSPLRPDAGLIASSLETILARMSQATIQNQIHLRSYTVMREYELLGRKRDKPRSRVVASVTFRPLTSNSTIFKGARVMEWEKGIVRLALEREAALAKDGGVSDISEHNYNFLFLREEVTGKRRCHVLQLLPKRKDKNLLRGTIWVDAKTYVICRTDGEPAKSPSWWVRDVHIVLVYGDVGGM